MEQLFPNSDGVLFRKRAAVKSLTHVSGNDCLLTLTPAVQPLASAPDWVREWFPHHAAAGKKVLFQEVIYTP